MLGFIVFFLPAVVSVWCLEKWRKEQLGKRKWLYRYSLYAVIINLICCAVKKWILHTADAVIFSFTADMTPSVACNYLIMALPVAIGIVLAEIAGSRLIRLVFANKKEIAAKLTQMRKAFLPSVLHALPGVLVCVLVLLGFLALYSASWYKNTYGQLGFDSILYTLLSDLGGVESDLLNAYLKEALIPALCWSIPICVLLLLPLKKTVTVTVRSRKLQLLPVKRVIAICLSIALFIGLLIPAAVMTEFFEYLKFSLSSTNIYQKEYVDPSSVDITFPKQKRNLIYIFLESMETTYFSQEQGGCLEDSAIPELYELAENNINFSPSDSVGGLKSGYGSTWTIGAMVAQTAGIPLKTPPGVDGNEYGQDDVFLPGLTSLTNILHDNGYHQTLMIGSDPTFGGRQQYFNSHGLDQIYSIFTAWSEGFVPGDYYEWWGIEGRKLFDYARQKLPGIAAGEQPFALTLLTVDTHHIDGYLCPECGDNSDLQYENVLSCSSRLVAEFIDWVQQQDFYENTSIIIVGDHPTMDNAYIENVNAQTFDRRVYNCFINSATTPAATKNREAFTVDMFPTTLAAIGCTIEGDRLGLGTNLFSDRPTLAEEMGVDAFNEEMGKHANYYTKKFFFASE